MCPHLNNNFTPVADNLPPAVVRSAESAAGGSDLPVQRTRSTGPASEAQLEIGQAVAGNSFEARGGVDGHARNVRSAKRESSAALTPSGWAQDGKAPNHSAGIEPGPLASFPIPHICISCGQTLRAKQDASRVVVYCGYGPCKSKAANEGAFGRTVDEAVDELNALILEEDV